MRLFFKSKDGGPDSNVTGYWLIESKKYFSIVLLRFSEGSREAYHNHAFNALSWVLYGAIYEKEKEGILGNWYLRSMKPIYTSRDRFHKVFGMAKATWILSFRGPWSKTWQEYNNKTGYITLTNGRKVVNEYSDN